MKLAPLPIKFTNSTTENTSITISPKEETRNFNVSKTPQTTTSVSVARKTETKSTNYILPLILVGGGIWYFTK